MKPDLIRMFVVVGLLALARPAMAQGTAFTYQGNLTIGGTAANGTYDLRFLLFNASSGGAQFGATVTNSSVGITNGLFTALLDYGAGIFNGTNVWLEIDVRTNGGGAFTALSPRQQVTPGPYAITAANLTGTLPASQLSGKLADARLSTNVPLLNGANAFTGNNSFAGVSSLTNANNALKGTLTGSVVGAASTATNFTGNLAGDVTGAQGATVVAGVGGQTAAGVAAGVVAANAAASANTPGTIVKRDASGNLAAGTITAAGFAGNGANLTNLNAGSLASGTVPDARLSANLARTNQVWLLDGNAGTTPGVNFLGTADNQPLELWANGARALRLEPDTSAFAAPNVIGGASVNVATPGVSGAVISGGGTSNYFGSAYPNLAGDSFNTIGGGMGNTIDTNTAFAVISGGGINTIQFRAINSTICGGAYNFIATNSFYATIAGGDNNTIQIGCGDTTIVGGYNNTIQNQAHDSFLGGGQNNLIRSASIYSVINGGFNNAIQSSSTYSAIGGGSGNVIGSSISYATVPGGNLNTAGGNYSFAAGFHAKALHDGAFVWADGTPADFVSTGLNQFCVRAGGGVQLDPGTSLFCGSQTRQMLNLWSTNYGIGVQTNTLYSRSSGGFAWYQGGAHNDTQTNSGGGSTLMLLNNAGLTVNGALVSASDRNLKEKFAPVDARAVLEKVAALPIQSWDYKADSSTRHLGPMAQDFYAAFGIGPDDRHIATVDEGGVALAAIQGLHEALREKEEEIKALKAALQAGNAALEKRLEILERLLANQKDQPAGASSPPKSTPDAGL